MNDQFQNLDNCNRGDPTVTLFEPGLRMINSIGSTGGRLPDEANRCTDGEGLHMVPTLSIDRAEHTSDQLNSSFEVNMTEDNRRTIGFGWLLWMMPEEQCLQRTQGHHIHSLRLNGRTHTIFFFFDLEPEPESLQVMSEFAGEPINVVRPSGEHARRQTKSSYGILRCRGGSSQSGIPSTADHWQQPMRLDLISDAGYPATQGTRGGARE
ncbi:hypothetical protein NLU13_1172 [Sarocladium strictum]|uniref:Uncharacterized protein n=1 Tax=Sarocladium strictum TaxID=5046 RepID=A0AA39GQF6_SARSR|nr:hypothetical protein NLU13_1172 [Sarocladium strictum]